MEEKEKEKEKEKEQKECGLVLEYQDASHLLSSISSRRIKFTAFDVAGTNIVFGTNTGTLQIFDVASLSLSRIVSTGVSDPITRVSLCPKKQSREWVVAASGATLIFVNINFDKEPAVLINCHQKKIVDFAWKFPFLYSGDQNGAIFETNVLKVKSVFYGSSKIAVCETIHQMDIINNDLLISTQKSAILFEIATQTSTKIGKKGRNGVYGACGHSFWDSYVFAARPAKKVWLANASDKREEEKGKVIAILEFPNLPSDPIYFSEEKRKKEKKAQKFPNFKLVKPFQEDCLLTWNDGNLVLIDVVKQAIEWYRWGVEEITDVVVAEDRIYVLHGEEKSFGILKGISVDDYFEGMAEGGEWGKCLWFVRRYQNSLSKSVKRTAVAQLTSVLEKEDNQEKTEIIRALLTILKGERKKKKKEKEEDDGEEERARLEREEQERKEREEEERREREEQERKEREEQERREREEREEQERKEREEQERKEREEQEKREREERERKEKEEQERKEREERERREREERERKEKEERERREREEQERREREEREKKEREERERKEREERERKEKEEKERREKEEKERKEREDRERKEREEKERKEREERKKEKQELERRLEEEKMKREELERGLKEQREKEKEERERQLEEEERKREELKKELKEERERDKEEQERRLEEEARKREELEKGLHEERKKEKERREREYEEEKRKREELERELREERAERERKEKEREEREKEQKEKERQEKEQKEKEEQETKEREEKERKEKEEKERREREEKERKEREEKERKEKEEKERKGREEKERKEREEKERREREEKERTEREEKERKERERKEREEKERKEREEKERKEKEEKERKEKEEKERKDREERERKEKERKEREERDRKEKEEKEKREKEERIKREQERKEREEQKRREREERRQREEQERKEREERDQKEREERKEREEQERKERDERDRREREERRAREEEERKEREERREKEEKEKEEKEEREKKLNEQEQKEKEKEENISPPPSPSHPPTTKKKFKKKKKKRIADIAPPSKTRFPSPSLTPPNHPSPSFNFGSPSLTTLSSSPTPPSSPTPRASSPSPPSPLPSPTGGGKGGMWGVGGMKEHKSLPSTQVEKMLAGVEREERSQGIKAEVKRQQEKEKEQKQEEQEQEQEQELKEQQTEQQALSRSASPPRIPSPSPVKLSASTPTQTSPIPPPTTTTTTTSEGSLANMPVIEGTTSLFFTETIEKTLEELENTSFSENFAQNLANLGSSFAESFGEIGGERERGGGRGRGRGGRGRGRGRGYGGERGGMMGGVGDMERGESRERAERGERGEREVGELAGRIEKMYSRLVEGGREKYSGVVYEMKGEMEGYNSVFRSHSLGIETLISTALSWLTTPQNEKKDKLLLTTSNPTTDWHASQSPLHRSFLPRHLLTELESLLPLLSPSSPSSSPSSSPAPPSFPSPNALPASPSPSLTKKIALLLATSFEHGLYLPSHFLSLSPSEKATARSLSHPSLLLFLRKQVDIAATNFITKYEKSLNLELYRCLIVANKAGLEGCFSTILSLFKASPDSTIEKMSAKIKVFLSGGGDGEGEGELLRVLSPKEGERTLHLVVEFLPLLFEKFSVKKMIDFCVENYPFILPENVADGLGVKRFSLGKACSSSSSSQQDKKRVFARYMRRLLGKYETCSMNKMYVHWLLSVALSQSSSSSSSSPKYKKIFCFQNLLQHIILHPSDPLSSSRSVSFLPSEHIIFPQQWEENKKMGNKKDGRGAKGEKGERGLEGVRFAYNSEVVFRLCSAFGFYFGEVVCAQRKYGVNSQKVVKLMFEADDWSSLSCYLHFPSTSFKTCTFVLKKYEKSVKEREEGVGEEEVREINSDRLSFVVFSVFGVEKGMKTISDYPLLLSGTTPELYRNILELVEKEKAQDDLFLKILQKFDEHLWSLRTTAPMCPQYSIFKTKEMAGKASSLPYVTQQGEKNTLAFDKKAPLPRYLESANVHWGIKAKKGGKCKGCEGELEREEVERRVDICCFPCGHCYHRVCVPEGSCPACLDVELESVNPLL